MPTIYSTTAQEGIDVNQVFTLDPVQTPEYPAPPFQPGELAYGTDGSEFVYSFASITIAPGSAVLLSPVPGSWSCALVGGATVATPPTGQLVGFTGGATGSVAIPAPSGTQRGNYFWVQRKGNVPNIKTLATTTKNAQLYSSATTAGSLTSTGGGAATTYLVNGVVVSQATGSAAGPNTAIANYPVVGATG